MSVHQIKIILQKQNSIVHHITANIAGDQLNSNLKKRKKEKKKRTDQSRDIHNLGKFYSIIDVGKF